MLSQFQEVGRALFAQGLISFQSGNLSLRQGDRMLITHRCSALGSICKPDLVETGIVKNSRATPFASSELSVHRCIYRNTSALAIVHAHPPCAVALSLMEREILPRDMEGRSLVPRVLVLGEEVMTEARRLREEIAQALKQDRVVLVKGHGSFATGQLLEEAYYYTTVLEQSCRLIFLLKALR
ncbi:MAG: aldolase [Chloroflexota bacterium]|nr:aldolase [Chloroflexota bacterium]